MTRASQAAPPCLMRLQGGAGPDLVLIHGFGSDRTSWAANVQALSAGSTVHAVDLPGHGDAGPDVGDGRIETLADSVEAALDRLAGGPVSLIGHSLGGGIALMLAARRPDRIRSLVLIAPAGLGRAVDPTFLRDYPHLREAGETEALLRRLVAKPRLINRQLVTLVQRQLQAPGRREALAGIARGLAAAIPDLRTAAATVVQGGLPRLTIWGEDDVINPHDADALAEFGGDACVIPGVGHLPQVEAAATVNARIAAFLNYTVVPVT